MALRGMERGGNGELTWVAFGESANRLSRLMYVASGTVTLGANQVARMGHQETDVTGVCGPKVSDFLSLEVVSDSVKYIK